jgi:beta-galactosidase
VVTSYYKLINDSATVIIAYHIFSDGTVNVYYHLGCKPGLPNIPKVGMQMGIKRSYDNLQWYGRGPQENYIDRRVGFEAGIYKMSIDSFIEPYVVPQENANRTDVRWLFAHNKNNKGILIAADSLLSVSAWPYTEQNIQSARHTYKLVDAGYITLNIDLIQMGVGGNDSWSDVAAPLEQYQVPAANYKYAFFIKPYTGRNAGDEAKKMRIQK